MTMACEVGKPAYTVQVVPQAYWSIDGKMFKLSDDDGNRLRYRFGLLLQAAASEKLLVEPETSPDRDYHLRPPQRFYLLGRHGLASASALADLGSDVFDERLRILNFTLYCGR